MTMKVLSQAATQRAVGFARDNVPPPQKLVEHKQRIEDWIAAVDRQVWDTGGYAVDRVRFVVDLRMELETLYGDWAEGTERTRWVDLPAKSDLSPDDIIREAVFSTESVCGATGIEVLALYLELFGHDGLFKKFVDRQLIEVRPLLEEVLPYEGKTVEILSNPKAYFATDEDDARHLTAHHFLPRVNRQSPLYVRNAMCAHIEHGLGNLVRSQWFSEGALREKMVPNLDERLHGIDKPAVEAALLDVEKHRAKILIDLLGRGKPN